MRIWLIGEKSRLILYNIIFGKPVYLYIRSSFIPGQRWQLGQSGQQCPSRGSRILWGALVFSTGVETFGIRSGFPRCLSLLSTRKLHFADSFAWRLCVHTNGKFAIGYVKLHRNEGAGKGGVAAWL